MEKLPPPVIPRTLYAAGLNYLAHIEWANSRGASHKVPPQPDIGYRAASALIERIANPVFMGLPSCYTVRPAAAAQAPGDRRDTTLGVAHNGSQARRLGAMR